MVMVSGRRTLRFTTPDGAKGTARIAPGSEGIHFVVTFGGKAEKLYYDLAYSI